MNKKILFFLFFSSTIAFATNPTETDGIKGNFDLGLNYTQNTNKTFQFNNVFLLHYKKGKSNFSLGNNMSFISKTGEDELLNKGTQDFKYSYISKKLGADITLQHLYDISRSITSRWTTGIGLSYPFIQEDDKKVTIGISVLKEKEIPINGEDKIQNRMSANLDFSIKLNKNAELLSANQYQPNIQQVGDFRLKTMLAIRISLNSRFLLSINNTFNYDSFPSEGIPETDYQLINSLSYAF